MGLLHVQFREAAVAADRERGRRTGLHWLGGRHKGWAGGQVPRLAATDCSSSSLSPQGSK